MRWRRFVAIGDSFTEGMNDFAPDGSLRGWADLVAAALARSAPDGDFRYANLAIRGRLFHRIVDEQVPVALEMKPDLVSFAGGGNDALRRNFAPEPIITRFDEVIGSLRAGGADVIVFRWVDVSGRLPGSKLILPRSRLLNEAAAEIARRHGAILVDLWGDDEFRNPLLWSDDRLHMSTLGHRRVAAHVLTSLGITPDPDWLTSPGRPPRQSWPQARLQDVRWAQQHLAPWVRRRLTGRSSGDTITAKRPTLAPFETV
jgi:lysophospholipase L1-like esterase